jgi:tight adherence protein B
VLTSFVEAASGVGMTSVLVRAARRTPTRARAAALAPRATPRLPSRVRDPVARALRELEVDATPEDALLLSAACVGAVVMLAAVVAPVLAVAVLVGALVAVPLALRAAHRRARRRFVVALPVMLEQVAGMLRAGESVPEALQGVVALQGAVRNDVRGVLARRDLGLPLPEALSVWPEQRAVPAVRAVAGALAVAASLGGRSATALEGLAASLRARLDVAAEARALTTQARLSALVVGAAPLAFLAVATALDPGSAERLVTTGAGRTCLVVGLALEAAGVAWMRRLVGETP